MSPLAIDLCSGLGGWAEGLEAEGYHVIRVDIEDMFAATGTPKPADCLLLIQDILTFHGSQAKGAAMPWSRAKAKAAAIRADETGAELARLNRLFNACFRIQREACEAAGRHIPLVLENVRGAQPWVGRAAWNFGSFYLWGDVPALMPAVIARKNAHVGGGSWFNIGSPGQTSIGGNPDGRKVSGFRFDGSGRSFQTAAVNDHVKMPGHSMSRGAPKWNTHHGDSVAAVAEGRKGAGAEWFDQNHCQLSSNSPARKRAAAQIAKIPLPLSRHIARVYHPRSAA